MFERRHLSFILPGLFRAASGSSFFRRLAFAGNAPGHA
jgi:hypothetical protein